METLDKEKAPEIIIQQSKDTVIPDERIYSERITYDAETGAYIFILNSEYFYGGVLLPSQVAVKGLFSIIIHHN